MSLQESFDTAQDAVMSDIADTTIMSLSGCAVEAGIEYSYLSDFMNLQRRTKASVKYCDTLKGDNAPLAVYTSFSFPPKAPCETGFTNEVTVYGQGERSFQSREISSSHEMLHASQWDQSPALHAAHLNARSHFVMNLRDWVKATLLTEAEAYLKTAMLAYGMAAVYKDEAFAEATESHPVSVQQIRNAMEENPNGEDLNRALVDLAISGMQKMHHDEDGRAVSFAEFYANKAVEDYARSWRLTEDEFKEKFPYCFVRLEAQDFDAMGAAFGPDIMPMISQRYDQGVFAFSEQLENKISETENKLRIPAATTMPSFSGALYMAGQTHDSFIERSKTFSVCAEPATMHQEGPKSFAMV